MIELIFNLALMILGFGFLIFVHELGHFVAARWAGIRTEVFAVGMGTPVFSWRGGIGFAWGSTQSKVVERTGKVPRDLSRDELERHAIGATEYSLRWLPIGGFVKMLGQDDADPKYVSSEPDSYNVCPVGKRMVVVSAGVVANIILAVVVFIVAFLVGVPSFKPVVGGVARTLPAGTAVARNAGALGISEPGMRGGDLITRIGDKEVATFVDVRIATAMAKPGQALVFEVERPGVPEPLVFEITPEKDNEGLLGIGIEPGRSNRLWDDDGDGSLAAFLEELGLAQSGVEPGMSMVSAAGKPIEAFEQLQDQVDRFDGKPVPTRWTALDEDGQPTGPLISAEVPVRPDYQIIRYAAPVPGIDQNVEMGLLGLTPLVEIIETARRSPNQDTLKPGDVILRAGSEDGPRLVTLRSELARHKGGQVELLLLRDGEQIEVTAEVDRKGQLGIQPGWAWDLPYTARPMEQMRTEPGPDERSQTVPTPVGALLLFARTRFDAVNDTPVEDWATFREALRNSTLSAFETGHGASVTLRVTHPTPRNERETVVLELDGETVAALHELGWSSRLPGSFFEPLYTTLSAGGNPWRAAVMGFTETHKVVVMTYLTIDRLMRGSVGVEQIRGPVGIVHIGAEVAERGVTYLLFFLGIISVNLAVINFLPIPIVDGGLFLFLIYEKLKGKPPSLAFQNAATLLGVALIATALLVVTWNDLVRLVG